MSRTVAVVISVVIAVVISRSGGCNVRPQVEDQGSRLNCPDLHGRGHSRCTVD